MNRANIAQIIIIVFTIVALLAFFLPYISATDDFRAYINKHADEKVYSTVDLTIGDMADMSLFTYGHVYFQGGEEVLHSKESGIFYGVLIFSVAGFALLVLLAAWGKKPILTLILDFLMASAFYLINWDFVDRGIMPDSRRAWAISYNLYYPLAAIIAICAIWMIIEKRRAKRE